MGIIMGSVTDIVNTISLVLIAFVSISLVVSSIMIGIITYISVLERKRRLAFCARSARRSATWQTCSTPRPLSEGLIAGVFAVVVVVAVSFPVNAWALAAKQVPNLMSLPVQDALVLIAISVLLTVVAGPLPARSASKKDPVEALRSNNVTKGQSFVTFVDMRRVDDPFAGPYGGDYRACSVACMRSASVRSIAITRRFLPPPRVGNRFGGKGVWETILPINQGLNVVPQLMSRTRTSLWGGTGARRHGLPRVNLNLGCPSGTVVAKGKGSGFLRNLDELEAFLKRCASGRRCRCR